MKKMNASLFTFLLSVALLLFTSFTASFLAFGLEEEEIVASSVKQACYRIFLFFRFPSYHISLLHGLFPAVHQQLIFSSVVYALVITLFNSAFQVIKTE